MPLPQLQFLNLAQIDQQATNAENARYTNAIARLQMQQAERAQQDDATLRDVLSQTGGDYEKAKTALMGKGLYKPAMEIGKQQREAEKAGYETRKLKAEAAMKNVELIGVKLANVSTDDDALSVIQEIAGDDPRYANLLRTSYQTERGRGKQPGQIAQEFGSALNKEVLAKVKAYAPDLDWQDLGGTKVATNKNALAGPVGPMESVAPLEKTATPGEVMADTRGRDEGAANRAVTVRGQNMTDARAKEHNQILQGNQRQQGTIELRKEFNNLPEVKNYKEVLPIIQSVKNAPNTPAGDIDLIYGVGKIMDPNSVVREGEMNLVIKSGSPAQRFQGWVNYIKGGGRLAPAQRQELMAIMDSRLGGLEANYTRARTTYETAADRQGLPKDQIFNDAPVQQPTAKAAAKTTELDAPPNPAQYKGAIMTDSKTGIRYQSDGSNWVKVK